MQKENPFNIVEKFKLFKDIYNQISIGLLVFSTEDELIFANHQAVELFSYKEDELVERSFDQLFYNESNFNLKNWYNKSKTKIRKTEKYHILCIKNRNNDLIWCIANFSMIKIEKELILCQLKNISELKEAAEKISRNSHLLTELINAIPYNIYIKDKKSRFIFANVSVARVMGAADPGVLIGKDDFDFHPKKLASKYFKDEQEVVKTGIAKINIIEQVVQDENNRRWYSTSKLPLKDNEGKIIGTMGIGRDITQWVKEQKALKKAKHTAEKADHLKSAFLANLSHEIRTPLNGILGFSQFLKQSTPQISKNHKYIDFIIANGQQLLHLISDIIDISKIDSGQIRINKKNFILNELLKQIKVSLEKHISTISKDLNVKLELALNDNNSLIHGDDLRIKQVLENLVRNAAKFTNKGTITFGYSIIKKDLKFFVRDQGIGISTDNLSAIFDRFRQVDYTLTRQYEGAGLGLSIAKGLVELMGGEIHVKSKINEGSEFNFTLPYIKAQLKEIDKKKGENQTLKNKKIAVIEDDDKLYDLIEVNLFQQDAQVSRAGSDNEFFEIFNSFQTPPDLLIINLNTKWIDPCLVIERAKSLAPQMSILAIANNIFKVRKEDCISDMIDDYIIEPVNYDLMIEKLKYIAKK